MKFYNKILAIVRSNMLNEMGVEPENLNNVKIMFVWEHERCSETDIISYKDARNVEQMNYETLAQFWKRHGVYPNFATIYGIKIGDCKYEIDIHEDDLIPITTKLMNGVIVDAATDMDLIVKKYLDMYQE